MHVQVYLAVTDALVPGAYYSDCNVEGTSAHAQSKALGKQLWAWTEKQVSLGRQKPGADGGLGEE